MKNTMENAKFLRKVLWANVIFSELSAIVAIFFSSEWIAINDMTHGQGLTFGIQLFVFAGFVAYAAWRKKISGSMIWIIIFLDLLYVLGTLIRLGTDPSFSLAGMVVTAFTVAVVFTLAMLQYKGLRMYQNQLKAAN